MTVTRDTFKYTRWDMVKLWLFRMELIHSVVERGEREVL